MHTHLKEDATKDHSSFGGGGTTDDTTGAAKYDALFKDYTALQE